MYLLFVGPGFICYSFVTCGMQRKALAQRHPKHDSRIISLKLGAHIAAAVHFINRFWPRCPIYFLYFFLGTYLPTDFFKPKVPTQTLCTNGQGLEQFLASHDLFVVIGKGIVYPLAWLNLSLPTFDHVEPGPSFNDS